MSKTTITINGRVYDAITGMPMVTDATQVTASQPEQPAAESIQPQTVALPKKRIFSDIGPAAQKKPKQVLAAPSKHKTPKTNTPAAQAVHHTTQKSHTLYRKALQKPQPEPAVAKTPQERSPMISRFGAEKPTGTPTAEPPREPHEQPPQQAVMHPTVAKVLRQTVAKSPQTARPQPSGKELKELLIKERLAEVGNTPAKREKRGNWLSRQPRMVTILSSTLALLILGGYLTYITLPSISLRVAASRAGVNASMPEYKPDGYSLDGPITYSPGEVIINYTSNTNETGYKLTQKATNWDSQAVLDNYVSRLTDNYLTFQERGITVYTFGNKAAWVNGGLLYTIDGNAALSSDQILRVATSL